MVHKSGINSPVAGLVVHLPWFNRGLILHHPKPGQFFLAGFHTYSPHFNPPTCFAEPKVQARRWNEHTLAPPDIVVDITPHSALQYARSLPSWREMHRTCPPRSNWPLGLYHPADEPTNQVVVVVWTTRKHHGCLTCWPAKKTQQRNNNKKRGDPGKQKITDVFHHRKRMFFLKWSFLGEKWVKGKPPNKGELIHLKIELKKSFVYWRLCTTCISEKTTVKRFLRHQKNIPKDSQRAMSSASNVSTSSKDIKFPETFFCFLLEKEEFSPFCWDKIETINDPSTNTFYLQGHMFFLRTPDGVVFLGGKVKVFFLNRCYAQPKVSKGYPQKA